MVVLVLQSTVSYIGQITVATVIKKMTLIKNWTPFVFLMLFTVMGLSKAGATDLKSNHYKPNTRLVADKQLIDVVPDRFLVNQGVLETDIYVANYPSPYPKVSTEIFNGALTTVQDLSNHAFFGISFVLTSFFFFNLYGYQSKRKKSKSLIALSLASILSIFASLRLSEGWDELFINLRHPYMLLEHGVYSINAGSMYEASVDFLPLILTAFLAWIGLGLLNGLLIMSLLGNIVLIVVTFLLVSRITKSESWGLISAFLIGIYPNVLFIGASGFSATLFCGAIFASSYFLLYTDKRMVGILFLSSLTLIRTEGILFSCLMLFYIDIVRPLPSTLYPNHFGKTVRKWLIDGAIILSPFLVSLVVRYYFYGLAIPNPITFKNANFDHFYLLNGIRQLGKIFVTHDLYMVIFLIVLLWMFVRLGLKGQSNFSRRIDFKKLFGLCTVVTIFILPYFAGGGDWFPIFWNRYALPLNLILSISLLVLIHYFFTGNNFILLKSSILTCMGMTFIIFYSLVDPHNPDHFLNRTFVVASQENGPKLFGGGNWIRIDRFSNLGQFLNQTLPLDATVASGEEATIMYFSKREMIGLLGVSNPEIAAMPLQPLTPGDNQHRRRAYAAIYRLRPDIIALNDPDQLGNFSDSHTRLEQVHQTLQYDLFQQYYVDKNYYLVGSFEALKKMGYRHLTIVFDDRLFSLFVNERIYKQFIHNIQSQGFSYAGADKIHYHVNAIVTNKFSPAVDSLMNNL